MLQFRKIILTNLGALGTADHVTLLRLFDFTSLFISGVDIDSASSLRSVSFAWRPNGAASLARRLVCMASVSAASRQCGARVSRLLCRVFEAAVFAAIVFAGSIFTETLLGAFVFAATVFAATRPRRNCELL